jgi:hypothetical protein
MLFAGMSRNALELGALRALTDIGIGGQWQPAELYCLFVMPLLVAGAAVLLIGPAHDATETQSSADPKANASLVADSSLRSR